MSVAHRAGRLLGLAGLTVILVATLYPSHPKPPAEIAAHHWCLVCEGDWAMDLALNVLLFIPYALGLRLAGVSWRAAVGVAALTSLGVEVLQIRVIPGRYAGVADVVANTAGGMIGAGVAPWARGLLAPGSRLAGWLDWRRPHREP